MAHDPMENHDGLVVDATPTYAMGTAQREAALTMLGRMKGPSHHAGGGQGLQYRAIRRRIVRDRRHAVSQRTRKRIEKVQPWNL